MSKKNVSVLVSAAGWIGGFMDKLVIALRNYGVSDEQIHALVTQEGDAFVNKMANVIAMSMGPVRVKKISFTIFVDYGIGIETLLARGRYEWFDAIGITAERFPADRTGTAGIEVVLINFGHVVATDEALDELNWMGYRPADAHELLQLGVEHEYLPYMIVELGSVWHDEKGRHITIVLDGTSGRLKAGLSRQDPHDDFDPKMSWVEETYFAVVRKPVSQALES